MGKRKKQVTKYENNSFITIFLQVTALFAWNKRVGERTATFNGFQRQLSRASFKCITFPNIKKGG